METFFVFLDESRCYHQKRDLTADFRWKSFKSKSQLWLKSRKVVLGQMQTTPTTQPRLVNNSRAIGVGYQRKILAFHFITPGINNISWLTAIAH